MTQKDKRTISALAMVTILVYVTFFGLFGLGTSSAQTRVNTTFNVWFRIDEGKSNINLKNKLSRHFRDIRGTKIVDDEEATDLKVQVVALQSNTIKKFYTKDGRDRGETIRHLDHWSISYTLMLRTKHKGAVIFVSQGLISNVHVDEIDEHCKRIADEANEKVFKPIRAQLARN